MGYPNRPHVYFALLCSLRRLKAMLAQHPVGGRILHMASESAVNSFLADAAVVAALSEPPSKEIAVELRELFARSFCSREFEVKCGANATAWAQSPTHPTLGAQEFGVSVEARSTRRAIEHIVATWDWYLLRSPPLAIAAAHANVKPAPVAGTCGASSRASSGTW